MVNYSMEGRTYRYFKGPGDPQFPFGYGLSYSSFHYQSLMVTPESVKAGDNVTVQISVTNTGTLAADEVQPFPQHQLITLYNLKTELSKYCMMMY